MAIGGTSQLVLIDTPHLQDKVRGTRRTLERACDIAAPPQRVWIDITWRNTRCAQPLGGRAMGSVHSFNIASDHEVFSPQTRGRHAAGAVRPLSGSLVDSSADWGPSDPFTLAGVRSGIPPSRPDPSQEAIEVFHNKSLPLPGAEPRV